MMQGNASNNEEPNKNYFALSDEDLPQLNHKFKFDTSDFDSKYKSAIFPKFFINSIFTVQKNESRSILLKKLREQLDAKDNNITLDDIDVLYNCLFNDLPVFKPLHEYSDNVELLFEIMNLFIMRFYYIAFPFFYSIKIDDNIFSHDPSFTVKYFLKFVYCLKFSKIVDTKYIELLKNDGSLISIFNYLFDLYNHGTDFDNVSNCIYQLMEVIDCDFLYTYLQEKKFFDQCFGVFINNNNNSIFRLNYPIAFFTNFFKKRYSSVNYAKHIFNFNKESDEENKKKQETSEKIIHDIQILKIQNYLQSFLGSYIDQLIREGRLLNATNPFETIQPTQKNITIKYFPERTNDDDILNIFKLFMIMFKTIPEPKYQTCILDFFPLILEVYKIIPGLFFKDNTEWTLQLYDYLVMLQLPQIEAFLSTFLEIIHNRLVGNYKPSENIQNSIFYGNLQLKSGQYKNIQHLLSKVNKVSIASFIKCIFTTNKFFFKPPEFFQLLQLSDCQHVNELLRVMIYISKKNDQLKEIAFTAFLFYLNLSENPILIKSYVKLLFILNLNDDQFKSIIDTPFIPTYINIFLNEPEITKILKKQQIIKFCQITGKYVVGNKEFVENVFKSSIESGDLFKMKIASIILNYGDEELYKAFSNFIFQNILNQSAAFNSNDQNTSIIQNIITFSPLLYTFKFPENDILFTLLKSSLTYLNSIGSNQEQSKQDIITIYKYHESEEDLLQFENSIDQAKANLIYSLVNSFGFSAQPEYCEIISYFLNKYGMCIEVLNFLSNIIECLTQFINLQNFPDQIQETNKLIFKITQVLMENYPEEKSPNEEEQNKPISNGDFNSRLSSYKKSPKGPDPNQSILHYFALFPIGYEEKMSISSDKENTNIIKNCFYSYKMNGTKYNDHFVYAKSSLKLHVSNNLKSKFEEQAQNTVNFFVRNIAEYTISMLCRYGVRGSIKFYTEIILNAFKHGLIRVDYLDYFFNFMLMQNGPLFDQVDAGTWIHEAIKRASILMVSVQQLSFDFSGRLMIGTRKDQLIRIYDFLYRMDKIFIGFLNEQLIQAMFRYSNCSLDSFMNFIRSNEADMKINLERCFSI